MPLLSPATVPLDCRLTAPCYPDWRAALADAVRDPTLLCRLLKLPPSLAETAKLGAKGFPLLVPRPYLSRIRMGDPSDPLLLQVLPTEGELIHSSRFTTDPIGEASSTLPGGILWKYQARVLMVTTAVCAVHCRFCFRRHFPFEASGRDGLHWEMALAKIASEESVSEVILSGGDPLCLDDEVLAGLVGRLDGIPHLLRLRVHTRQPVLIPQRVTDALLTTFRGSRLTSILVLHVNHPAEIDRAVEEAIGRLVDAGVPVLQQAVLLRGVNDGVDVLTELYQRLVDLRVMPYYLHQLDRVAGAAHFEVAPEEGVRLIGELRRRLPGYAVPRYVRETASAPNKVPLA